MNDLLDLFHLTGSTEPMFWTTWGPTLGVFVVATAVFYAVARLVTRRPNREELRLREIRAHGLEIEEEDEGVFGPLTEPWPPSCLSRRKSGATSKCCCVRLASTARLPAIRFTPRVSCC